MNPSALILAPIEEFEIAKHVMFRRRKRMSPYLMYLGMTGECSYDCKES